MLGASTSLTVLCVIREHAHLDVVGVDCDGAIWVRTDSQSPVRAEIPISSQATTSDDAPHLRNERRIEVGELFPEQRPYAGENPHRLVVELERDFADVIRREVRVTKTAGRVGVLEGVDGVKV